jgi:hypothetical protein
MTQEDIEKRIEKMTKRLTLRHLIKALIQDVQQEMHAPTDNLIVSRIKGYLNRDDLHEETRYVLQQLVRE